MNNSTVSNNKSDYEEIVSKNRYGIRNLQAKYLQNEYDRMQQAKNAQKAAIKSEKERQYQMLTILNDKYQQDVVNNRRKKLQQRESLSMEYNDFIKNNQQKQKLGKLIQKNIEKSTLVAPTWVRDVVSERQVQRRNMLNLHYIALGDHVKLQHMRKEFEKQQQNSIKKRIDQEAEEILKKEYQYLQARHRQKSMFEKRQNQLLGVQSNVPKYHEQSDFHPRETNLKRKQQDLYSQGLQLQLKKEQDKRNNFEKIQPYTSNIYNPITNPIPFVYKNPNVLRMMAEI